MSITDVPKWLQDLPNWEKLITYPKLLIYICDPWVIDTATTEINQIKQTGCILAQWDSAASVNDLDRLKRYEGTIDAWVGHSQIIVGPEFTRTELEKKDSNGFQRRLNEVYVLRSIFNHDAALIIDNFVSVVEMPKMDDDSVSLTSPGGSVKARIADLLRLRRSLSE